ncbi:hypothetical protein LSH36_188g03057 [Paralvinella palmiformis]|uniref:Uncharacterized protein n=1 Tax=Paralvinella palmiformis TaxID=53620 RepID=A0AAD9JS44_9ANNE|nr:hypothetical protein LSH36_188g03057 [Paralvinella palmiformis]
MKAPTSRRRKPINASVVNKLQCLFVINSLCTQMRSYLRLAQRRFIQTRRSRRWRPRKSSCRKDAMKKSRATKHRPGEEDFPFWE